jgi:hypothetical protein
MYINCRSFDVAQFFCRCKIVIPFNILLHAHNYQIQYNRVLSVLKGTQKTCRSGKKASSYISAYISIA